MTWEDRLEDIRRVSAKEDVRALARRYFIANGFDGTLTTIGVVVGAYLSGIQDGFVVIGIGAGAAVGLGTSGIWSIWEIERAETSREQLQLEEALLTSLDETQYTRHLRIEQVLLSVSAAVGPVLAVTLMLLPFFAVGVSYSMGTAVLLSIGVGIVILALAGAYLGSISGQRWYLAAARMGLAGLVVAVLSVLLPG